MKKLLLCLVFVFVSISSFAQADDSKRAVDQFITQFNEQKFEEIYENFAPSFKTQVPRDAGIGLLSQVSGITGNLEKGELISAVSGNYRYLLHGKKANVAFTFVLTGSKLDRVGIRPAGAGDVPASMNRVLLKTDNPKATSLEQKINSSLEALQGDGKLIGVSIGMLDKNDEHYYGYGETVKGNGILPSKAALFDAGSVTKTFTSYMLAKLVTTGKLKPEATLGDYFTGLDPKLAAITLVQLSNHTSGLPRMGKRPENGEPGRDANEKYTVADLEKDLREIQLEAIPGQRFAYSNLGVAVLGQILEKATGKTYPQLLDQYVLKPLKMANTFFQAPGNYPVFTKGYDVGGVEKDYLKLTTYGPAGNIKTTAEDLLKWAKFMMSNDAAATRMRQITFSPEKGNKIGLAWIVIPMDGKEFFYHNGATIGYRSYLAIYPETQKAVVLLSNSSVNIDPAGMAIVRELLR